MLRAVADVEEVAAVAFQEEGKNAALAVFEKVASGVKIHSKMFVVLNEFVLISGFLVVACRLQA